MTCAYGKINTTMTSAPKHKNLNGFTIIELLIVIVVIGILAAITIVAFNGVQGRSQDASIQSDIRQIVQKTHAYNVEKGNYPRDLTELSTIGVRVAPNAYDTSIQYNLSFCYSTDDVNRFAVHALSRSGAVYMYGSTSGKLERYTGAVSYTGSSYTAFCSLAEPGTTGTSGSGWTGTAWRPWAGI